MDSDNYTTAEGGVATQNVITLQNVVITTFCFANCIDIYRQNVVIYYKTGYHFFYIYSLNVVTYYNMAHKCSTNIIPNVVT